MCSTYWINRRTNGTISVSVNGKVLLKVANQQQFLNRFFAPKMYSKGLLLIPFFLYRKKIEVN